MDSQLVDFRKESWAKGLLALFTTQDYWVDLGVDDYQKK